MKESIKKRLNKLHKELITPHADCLVAREADGVVTWMGVEYKTEAELHKALDYYGVTSAHPLVVMTSTFHEKEEQSLTE